MVIIGDLNLPTTQTRCKATYQSFYHAVNPCPAGPASPSGSAPYPTQSNQSTSLRTQLLQSLKSYFSKNFTFSIWTQDSFKIRNSDGDINFFLKTRLGGAVRFRGEVRSQSASIQDQPSTSIQMPRIVKTPRSAESLERDVGMPGIQNIFSSAIKTPRIKNVRRNSNEVIRLGLSSAGLFWVARYYWFLAD